MSFAEIPLELTTELLGSVGKLGLYLQAIGAIVIIWLVFQTADLVMNYKMKRKMEEIDKKLDKLKQQLEPTSKTPKKKTKRKN